LIDIQRSLRDGSYLPGEYRLFTIYERKPRQIAAAPFRDRVVHHALINLIEAPIDKTFIFDTYACRAGKGVHKAVDRYQQWARDYRYVLKIDISQYFPSIDRQLLLAKLQHRIKDPRVLDLLAKIIHHSPDFPPNSSVPLAYFPGDDLLTPLERSKGIPIGNLTSQFFANLYLDDFDHFVKHQLKVKAYCRYVDDMVLLANDKTQLHTWLAQIKQRLANDRLLLHPHKAHIYPTAMGINFLGYLIWPDRRQLRNDNGHHFARKFRRYAKDFGNDRMDWDELHARVRAWIGHAMHGETLGLRRAIFSDILLTRGVRR